MKIIIIVHVVSFNHEMNEVAVAAVVVVAVLFVVLSVKVS